MALLSSQDIVSITSDIREIIGDSSVGTTIKYRLSGTSREEFFDPSSQELGEVSFGYAESSVSAFKSAYNLKEVLESGGRIEYGDLKFIVMTSDVSGILSISDTIYEPSSNNVQAGTTYQVVNTGRDPLNICYFLQSRAVG